MLLRDFLKCDAKLLGGSKRSAISAILQSTSYCSNAGRMMVKVVPTPNSDSKEI